MFSNSKLSEINPRGGVSIFKISLTFKKSEISDRGGRSSLFGKKSAIFPFFNHDDSPKTLVLLKEWDLLILLPFPVSENTKLDIPT